MSIVELMDKYDGLGVRFWLDDGQLRFRAPSGTLSEQRMEELRAHKEDLIAYLKTPENTVAVHDPANRFEPFPLTPIQGAYLVGRGSGFEYGGVGCHGYVELSLPLLDRDRLEAAWHSLIMRHDMLRAVVLENGFQQVLREVVPPPLKEQDLRGADAGRIRAGIKKIRDQLSVKKYQPGEWPLFDLVLTTLDNGSILHFSLDMLLGDFISIDILLGELDHLYHTPGEALPDLEVTFRDVVLFERALQERPSMISRKETDRQYWISRVADMPGAPDLPVNIGPLEPDGVTFERHGARLDKAKWASLRQYARNHKITPSCAVLSAFSETIGRWSKQSGFCLNITVLLRPEIHHQVNKIVGDFTSVNVLEIKPHGDTTFLERTRVLQERLWQDMEHPSFTGIDVLREMSRQRGKRVIIPIVFTSMLGLETPKRAAGEFMSDARLDYGISQTPQVSIDCQVSEHHGVLHFNWDVRSGIFPEGMIEDAFGVFSQLLEEMSRQGDIWLTGTPLKLPAHVRAVRNAVNDTPDQFPDSLLQDGFYHYMQEHPDAPALVGSGRQFTYRELGCHAAALQQALRESDCADGDIVAVILEKGVWQVASVLGTLFAGGVYLPIDTEEPRARMNTILTDSGARFVIAAGDLARRTWPGQIRVIDIETVTPDQNRLPDPVNTDPGAPAYIIYTSGSTGKPKGVMMTHRAAQNTIQDINKRFDATAGDRILCLANLNFDLSVYDIFGLLAAGGILVMPEPGRRKDPSHWFELIEEHGVTMWNSVPAQMHMLLTYLDSRDEPAGTTTSLRIAMMSGDWIPPQLPGTLWGHCPDIRIISLGGATEAGIWSIFYDILEVPEGAASIPYGIPLANQQIHILNDRMQPCPDWTAGDIYIGGESLATGYLNNPRRTREQFITHPHTREPLYKTGDLGRYRPDGVVEFLGREDTQVKIRGFRIELGEIEKAARNHPDISLAVAMITGDVPLDRQLALFGEAKLVTPREEASATIPALRETCQKAGREITAKIDRPLLGQWITLADKAALANMMETFQGAGLFRENESRHSFTEIIAALDVMPGFHSTLRRWLDVLCAGGILDTADDGASFCPAGDPPDREAPAACWKALEAAEQKVRFSEEFIRFLQLAGKNLSGLLSGEVDPIELFFPEGRLETALAAYSDNFINRYLNRVVKEGVLSIARTHQERSGGPLRILEIGAGTAGTTMALLPGLADFEVDYLFTDVSRFFLNEAEKRFASYPWVRYGLYDLNRDYWTQDMEAASWDIIICANVIHNAHNVPAALSTLKELAVPGGFLCIIEGTAEPASWLTSLEFVFKKQGLRFSDERAGNETAFLSYESWLSMLSGIHADLICAYPEKEDLFTVAGQTVFIARLPLERVSVSSRVLKDHLTSQLPRHMVPDYIEILPGIPLSPNGKIDRGTLKSRVDSLKRGDSQVAEPPKPGLEKQIADIWCAVLNRPEIGRDEDFFSVGGDSLLVAQVIAKMRENLVQAKEVKWDDMMRHMLQSPTVAAVAETLSSRDGEPGGEQGRDSAPAKPGVSFTILAQGKPEANGMRVIFHTGNGNLAPYRHLLQHLINDPDRRAPIAGISISDADYLLSLPQEGLIQELGRQYAALIRQHRARKRRIELIGYCSGGLMVLETARHLIEFGIDLGPVTIIDTGTVPCRIEDDLLIERFFAQQQGAELEKTGHFPDQELLASAVSQFLDTQDRQDPTIPHGFLRSLDGEFSVIADCYETLSATSRSRRLLEIAAAMPGAGEQGTSAFQGDVFTILYRIFRHTFQGITQYRPQPFSGDVRLLCARDQSLQAIPGIPSNIKAFWREVTRGNLDIIDVGGNHLSCMQPPHVSGAAGLLMHRGDR